MTQDQTRENKMGTMPVLRLLITMSLPMVVAMLVQALYNVVDTFYVSKFSGDALTAVSGAFAAQNLMIGIATGTGVGINALLSRSLGEKNFERANRVAGNGVLLAIFGYLISLVFGLFFVGTYFGKISSIPSIQQQGIDYLTICCTLSIGVFIEITFERLMQATGKTIYTMFTQGIGAVINIVLDPILIFGYGPFPQMGIRGAAVATVAGQIIAGILAVILNALKNPEIKLSLKTFKPDFELIGKIYAVGVPSIIMVGIGSVMNFALNLILKSIDATEVSIAVFGIYFKLQSFVFMPLFGMNNGLIPIIAFNYGAKNRKRMLAALKYAAIIAVSIMLIGLAIFQIFPEALLNIFASEETDSAAILSMGVPALQRISLCFVFAGICIALGSVFQALGKGMLSMIVSIARQLVVLIPAAYLLSLTEKVSAVWFAFPIAEVMSLIVSLVGFVYVYRKIIRHIPDGQVVKPEKREKTV